MHHEATLKPYEATWKVYIVRDAEAMSEEAANCLLKTLEEPPPQVVLTAHGAHPGGPAADPGLPLPAGPHAPAAHLPDRGRLAGTVSAATASAPACWRGSAAAASAGPSRPPATDGAGGRQRLLDRLAGLSRATRVDRMAFAAEQGQRYGKDMTERESVHAVLGPVARWWRDLLLVKAGCHDRMVNADRAEALESETRRYSLAQIRAFLESLRARRAAAAPEREPSPGSGGARPGHAAWWPVSARA